MKMVTLPNGIFVIIPEILYGTTKLWVYVKVCFAAFFNEKYQLSIELQAEIGKIKNTELSRVIDFRI